MCGGWALNSAIFGTTCKPAKLTSQTEKPYHQVFTELHFNLHLQIVPNKKFTPLLLFLQKRSQTSTIPYDPFPNWCHVSLNLHLYCHLRNMWKNSNEFFEWDIQPLKNTSKILYRNGKIKPSSRKVINSVWCS